MANNAFIAQGHGWLQIKMLDSATGAGNGTWFDCGNYRQAAIHFTGVSGGTVKINGSCATSTPTATEHASEIATSGTNNTLVTIEPLPRFLKARVSSAGGTITANAVFRG